MVVVDGQPGLGKTEAVSHWHSQNASVYLRAHKMWDYSWFIKEFLANLGVETVPRGRRERFELILDHLDNLSTMAVARGETFSLIIDECDQVVNKPDIMEAIRSFSDLKLMPTILVGMGTLRDGLRRYPQINSRAPNKVEFRPLPYDDAVALMRGLCSVPVAEDLIQFCWKVSNGFSREMVEAVANIERLGLRIDLGPDGVTMADMAGQVVMSDRATSKYIVVPEAF